MSEEHLPQPALHQRHKRYRGKNPRRFEEKYKEHAGNAVTIAKVLASGKTPVGTHRPIMVAEILEVLGPQARRHCGKLLTEYADEPNAAQIGKALTGKRFVTTHALAGAIRAALPHVAREDCDLNIRRVFQALRIAVNDEFSALDAFLRNLPSCLKPGGRVAVLTFHSGEDRRLKKSFKSNHHNGVYSEIAREIIRPSAEEQRSNLRSAPAKLRWARRADL